MLNFRLSRALRSLPELWIVLGLCLALAVARRFVPPSLQGSLGWQIHPYQVFATMAALAIFCLPGAMLLRLLGIGGTWSTRLPTCFAASVGVWSVPGFLMGGSGRFSLQAIFAVGAGLTILLTLAAILRQLYRPAHPDDVAEEGRLDPGSEIYPGLVFLALAGLLAVTLVSFTAPVGVDDHLQLMYTQDDLVVPHVNEFEPVFGAGIRPNTRGSLTTWPINLAILTTLTGLPAPQTLWILRTPLALLGVAAFYAFCLRFSGRRNQALFTTVLYILIAFVLATKAEAIGFGIFVRAAQDKFVVRYLMFPMGLAWSLAYLKEPNRRVYWLTGVCTFGLAATHTIGAILLGIPLAALGVLHSLNHFQGVSLRAFSTLKAWPRQGKELVRRNWPMLRPLVALSVFSLVLLAIPAIQKGSPDAPVVAYSLTDTRDPTLWYRVALATNMNRLLVANHLGPGAYIVHPSVFLEAIIVLPALGLPLLWWKRRKDITSELVVGTFILNSVILLVPPIVQFIGDRATPWLLYRFVWPLTLLGPVVIGWGGWESIDRLRRHPAAARLSQALPSAVLVATAIVLAGAIYRGQIFLIETRANNVSGQCREIQPMLSRMPDLVGQGAVVLSTPDMELCIVSSAANAHTVEFGSTVTFNRFPQSRIPEAARRIADVYSFTIASVVDHALMDTLARWDVGLVLLRDDHPLVSQLRGMPRAFRLEVHEANYHVFRVLPGAGTHVLPGVEAKERWKTALWVGEDPLIAANTLLTEGKWDEAIEAYQALQSRSGQPFATPVTLGLGRAYLAAGEVEPAISAFAQAAELDPEDVQARILLGESSWIKGDFLQMAAAYRAAVAMLGWNAQGWQRLGDAYRFEGNPEAAHQAYEHAAAIDGPRGTSVYYLNLGAMYSASNWNEEAIEAMRHSNRIRETVGADSFLAALHIRQKDLEAAERVAQSGHRLDFWSDQPYLSLGQIALEHAESQQAIAHFRQAVFLRPQSPAFLPLTATISAGQGPAAALDELEDTIGYKLGFAFPLQTVGRTQMTLGEFDAALATAFQAWAWNPFSYPGAVLLGDLHFLLGKHGEAGQFYNTATQVGFEQDEPDTAAYLGLSALAQARGAWETAIGLDWMAMMSGPNASAPVTALGTAYAVRGESEQAAATYQFSIGLNPFVAGPYVALGNFQSDQGEFEEAQANFQTAIELQSDSTAAYRGLGRVALNLGRVSQAEEALRYSVGMQPGDAANRVALAQVLAQQGDFAAAVDQLDAAILLDPGDRDAYATLADVFLRQGRTARAEDVYRRLLEAMPQFGDAYVGLGRMRERQGDWEGAADIYRQAMEKVEPTISGKAALALADLLRRQGVFDQAQATYEQVLALQPMLAEGYLELAQFHSQRGRLAAAESVLRQGLELMPTSPALNVSLAGSLADQGDLDGALRAYQEALALSPGSGELIAGLANLHALRGDPESGLEELEAAILHSPGDTQLLAEAVVMAVNAGHPARATELARDLASLAPGSARSWRMVGLANDAIARFDQAEQAFFHAVQSEPGDTQAWLGLGDFLSGRGRTDEAIAALTQAAQTDRTTVEATLSLAQLYDRQGRTADALAQYTSAADADATQSAALLSLGWMEQRQGHFDAALQWFDRAAAATPASSQPYQARSNLYLVEGRFGQARQELAKAIAAAPGACSARVSLADFLSARGERTTAEDTYRQALDLAGCTFEAHLGLGNLYAVLGRPDLALVEYQTAITSAPGEPKGYVALADMHFSQADPDQAFLVFERGQAALPASGVLRMALSGRLLLYARHEDGLARAEEAVDLNPANPLAYLTLGRAWQTLGDYDEAERGFIGATQVDRNLALPQIYLGDFYVNSARFEEAEEAYRAAITLAPVDAQPYMALGAFLDFRGRTEEAFAVYRHGADSDRSRIDALLSLARLYQRIGDPVNSQAAIQEALATASFQVGSDRNPALVDVAPEAPATLVQAYLALGDLSRAEGEWEEAERAYREAITAAPGIVSGYVHLGEAYVSQGRWDEADAEFEAAIQVDPGSSGPRMAMGNLRRLRGAWSEAIDSFESAIAVAPSEVEAYVQLGLAYQLQGRPKEAAESFESAVRASPASSTAYIALGDWRRSKADRPAAEATYLEAARLSASDAKTYLALSDFYEEAGRRGDAWAQLEKALDVAPISSPVQIAIGDWHRLESDWESAEAAYRQAITFAPDEVQGYLRLAEALQSTGRPGEAWDLILDALQLAPASPMARVSLGDWNRLNVDTSSAQETYRQLIAEAPDEVMEPVRTGLDYLADGDVEQAYEQFAEAVAADPESLVPYLAMGQRYRLSANLVAAEQAYRLVVAETPGELEGYLHLAQLLREEGRTLEAHDLLVEATTAIRASAALVALGDLERDLGEWAASEEAYLGAVTLAPGDVDAYIRLGELYELLGQHGEGIAQFEAGATAAGLAPAVAVCGPGKLPAEGIPSASEPLDGRSVRAWRCQWDNRLWTSQSDVSAAPGSSTREPGSEGSNHLGVPWHSD